MKRRFEQWDGELIYDINEKDKLTVWWNAAENLIEYQFIYNNGTSSSQDDLLEYEDMTGEIKDELKLIRKNIKILSKQHDIKLPKMKKKDYKYLYGRTA